VVRWVKRILVFVLIVVLGVSAFGVFTVRRSFPQVRGMLQVAGLTSDVEVLRDDLGVPHIYASNQHDLFFAQGFTHAQDRFWQMDFWRHIGAGRLAEMFGADQVETDMFLRSLGFERLAEEEWAGVESPSRDILASYAAGVNAYLDSHSPADISLEYAILPMQNSGYEIEPWSPVDTLMWAKVMAWDLGANLEAEITRGVLGKDFEPERVGQLFPPMPMDKPVIVETGEQTSSDAASIEIPDAAVPALLSARAGVDLTAEVAGGGFEGIGSNNWVIGGEMTASGLPLLANDTHLSIQMPSIWYENGLHCEENRRSCPFDLIGYSFAGTPGVIIGHNDHHAWGVTNQAADTQDLFIERVNPDDPGQYEADGAWVDFETRTETLGVAGADDIDYQVLTTRHGPIISGTFLDDDEFDASSTVQTSDDYVVALAWKALEPSTLIDALMAINTASSYEEFMEAAGLWDIAPQNLVYADVEGNIAYRATGEIPVRAAGDGRYPVPGWTSEFDWVGSVPQDEMPTVLNPAQGFIESANQPILRPGSTPLIGIDGAHGYRAQRIVDMVVADDSHDVASMQKMQMDTHDGSAEFIVPWLLTVDPGNDDGVAVIQRLLESWATGANPFQATGRSSGAAAYMATWRHLLANTFHDELPEDHWPSGGSRWFEVIRLLLETPDDPWWDDATTPETESRDQILARSMLDAHADLTDLLGDDPDGWTWGELHIADFRSPTFGQSGIRPIEWLFNRAAPARVGGSESIVNAVGWDTSVSYVVDWVPSQRMVVDLANLDGSTFIHTTGQSGHAFHENYDSMIEMWTDGEHAPMPWSKETVESLAVDRLTLVPGE
jgi:penicillin amidase